MKALIFLFVFLLIGCISEKKARYRAEQFYKEHKSEFAQSCADAFPIKSQYIEGITIIRKDTTIQKGILLDCPKVNYGEIKVRCPDSKTIYVNTVRIDTVVKENTAKVSSLESKIQSVTTEFNVTSTINKKNESTAKNRLYIIIALCCALSLSAFYNIKHLV